MIRHGNMIVGWFGLELFGSSRRAKVRRKEKRTETEQRRKYNRHPYAVRARLKKWRGKVTRDSTIRDWLKGLWYVVDGRLIT